MLVGLRIALSTNVDDINALLAAGDLAGAGRDVHNLIATAGNLGAVAVATIAREIEMDCREGRAFSGPGAAARLTAASTEALRRLATFHG